MQPSTQSTGQPTRGPISSADAAKRVLATAGITGAALTLSAAAALPALASQADAHQSQGEQHTSHAQGSQGGSAQDGHNPPGNNGTVKIHQAARDSSPHNQPHVSCTFYVSFFGFDRTQPLTISFAGQAPTGKGTPITITDPTKRSLTSMTDAGGAGNDYDGDQGAYDATNLDLSALGAPAKQGYHIKLDVATGERGGHKYKVFWFTPCTGGTAPGGGTTESGGTTPTTPTTPTVSGTSAEAGATAPKTGSTGSTGGGAEVLGESLTRGTTTRGSAPAGAQVLGESLRRGSSAGLGALPFTGTEAGALSALGLAALGGGAALTVAGRRRRRSRNA
jgi:hypothetical protein